MAAVIDNAAWTALPIIITGPGDYRTRDGRRVTIHAVKEPGTFAAKGAIWKLFRGKETPRGYDIWHPNGRASLRTVGMKRDIVGRWIAPERGAA